MVKRVETLFSEEVDAAETKITEGLEVTGVDSVWAPIIASDRMLASGVAADLIEEIRRGYPELSDEEAQRLIAFGTAVGSVSLRKLFNPFAADQIWVQYREGSPLNQEDAVRRVARRLPGYTHRGITFES